MMMKMKLPILPCAEKLELVLSTAPAVSVIGCATRPVLVVATGRGFATRPWAQDRE